ncbi:hypothetical protein ACLH6Q_000835 [Campylobacter fetus]|uniref:hypothetical protein n=1 Tax=Campylobacter fetus TaxID=196 RepID=UPI0005092977|nr:hypothetical protein [Campylobacter fetus]AIR79075.1 nitrate reductase accessory protein [Campylobacter fetus subsp. fetus 04/554]EAH8299187.1 hypothetical protein [Campylobacter fetus]EAI5646595.1 hypothetical protein [Campylobacter fetus]EAI5945518.1 hypothetical protein [Campylobacter fetus]EAI7233109.1 hypothetical protein [Campylobacter fetus]
MKFFVVLFSFFVVLFADSKLDLDANVVGLKLDQNRLFIGLDSGELYDYNLEDKSLVKLLELPKISTTTQENIGSRISSIDNFKNKIAFIYETDNKLKRVGIFDGELTSFDVEEGMKQLFFIDENLVLLVSLSSEIYYLDLNSKKITLKAKLSYSSWIADSVYLSNKSCLVSVSEGGVVYYFDVKSKKVIKDLPIQKDILYSVGAVGDKFVAGSAENLAYYFDGFKPHIFKTDNKHVFRVGLSDEFGAYYTEDGIEIFSANGKKIKHIDYDKDQINYLLFWNNTLISASYDNTIYFWSIK